MPTMPSTWPAGVAVLTLSTCAAAVKRMMIVGRIQAHLLAVTHDILSELHVAPLPTLDL